MSDEQKITPGPWHWVNDTTDIPLDYSERSPRLIEECRETRVPSGYSLRTVAEFPSEYLKGTLPIFIGCVIQDDMAKADAKLIASLPEILAERDRYKAIIDRLPKTADGVPITPGMKVWNPGSHDGFAGQHSYVVVSSGIEDTDVGEFSTATKNFYSTEAAAEDAIKAARAANERAEQQKGAQP